MKSSYLFVFLGVACAAACSSADDEPVQDKKPTEVAPGASSSGTVDAKPVDDNSQLVSPEGTAGTLDPGFAREGVLSFSTAPGMPVFASDGSFAMCVGGFVRHYDKDGKRDGAFGDTDDGAGVKRCTGLLPQSDGGYVVYDSTGPTFTHVSKDGTVDDPRVGEAVETASSSSSSSGYLPNAGNVFGLTPDNAVLTTGAYGGFKIVKYNLDGKLADWAKNGVATPTDEYGSSFTPDAMVVKGDGSAVLVGNDDLYAMTAKGKLTNLTSDTGADSELFAFRNDLEISTLDGLVLDGKGRPLIATTKVDYESSSSYDDSDLAVVRLTADVDALDTSFGDKGLATAGLSRAYGTQVAVQLDGKVLVMGMVNQGASGSTSTPAKPAKLTLVRFTEDGELDKTFGDDGIAHPLDLEKGQSFTGGLLTVGKRGVIYVTGTLVTTTPSTSSSSSGSTSSSSTSAGVLLRVLP